MRTTFTWDPGPSRVVQPTGCGYPVNMIYDDGSARVVPLETKADEATIIVRVAGTESGTESIANRGKTE